MIAFSANLDELDKIGCGLRAQIVAANPGNRIFKHNLRERVQIRFAASHDGNFSFEKQIQFSGKRTFGTPRALGYSLNAAK